MLLVTRAFAVFGDDEVVDDDEFGDLDDLIRLDDTTEAPVEDDKEGVNTDEDEVSRWWPYAAAAAAA